LLHDQTNRQPSDVVLTYPSNQMNVRFGLGLFDVCPARDGGTGRTKACGQTLNKPPGTKPRNAAARLG
jgi:hypothetical protein